MAKKDKRKKKTPVVVVNDSFNLNYTTAGEPVVKASDRKGQKQKFKNDPPGKHFSHPQSRMYASASSHSPRFSRF